MLLGVAVLSLVLTTCHQAVAQDNKFFANAAPAQCRSITGKTCQFPFKYRGVTYYECTYKDTEDGQPWCATRLRSDGLTAMPNSYENCDQALCYVNEPICNTNDGPDAGNTCKFPFRFNGVTYNSCTDWRWGGRYNGRKWCSTQTDAYGNHINGQGYFAMCDCYGSGACGCNEIYYSEGIDARGAAASPGAGAGAGAGVGASSDAGDTPS